MSNRYDQRLCQELAALCFGKAVYSCGPVLALHDAEHRERAFAMLAEEFEFMEETIGRLLEEKMGPQKG